MKGNTSSKMVTVCASSASSGGGSTGFWQRLAPSIPHPLKCTLLFALAGKAQWIQPLLLENMDLRAWHRSCEANGNFVDFRA